MSYDIPYLATYNEVLDDLYCKPCQNPELIENIKEFYDFADQNEVFIYDINGERISPESLCALISKLFCPPNPNDNNRNAISNDDYDTSRIASWENKREERKLIEEDRDFGDEVEFDIDARFCQTKPAMECIQKEMKKVIDMFKKDYPTESDDGYYYCKYKNMTIELTVESKDNVFLHKFYAQHNKELRRAPIGLPRYALCLILCYMVDKGWVNKTAKIELDAAWYGKAKLIQLYESMGFWRKHILDSKPLPLTQTLVGSVSDVITRCTKNSSVKIFQEYPQDKTIYSGQDGEILVELKVTNTDMVNIDYINEADITASTAALICSMLKELVETNVISETATLTHVITYTKKRSANIEALLGLKDPVDYGIDYEYYMYPKYVKMESIVEEVLDHCKTPTQCFVEV